VIVQRMVDSRVSGVVQTINAARNDFREIVVNAGLGLGEGIVSGTVAADHVVVSKDSVRGPLRFSYVTADKQEYIVFDRRAGIGTARCAPPYHQRMRPALEYSELCDLTAAAAALEATYGHPLDIEFGIEGDRLWILQVRPVPASCAYLQETLNRHPLSGEHRP
jgi:phosphoenolpyruvate synthase/pyruvate phosphate dikinase